MHSRGRLLPLLTSCPSTRGEWIQKFPSVGKVGESGFEWRSRWIGENRDIIQRSIFLEPRREIDIHGSSKVADFWCGWNRLGLESLVASWIFFTWMGKSCSRFWHYLLDKSWFPILLEYFIIRGWFVLDTFSKCIIIITIIIHITCPKYKDICWGIFLQTEMSRFIGIPDPSISFKQITKQEED